MVVRKQFKVEIILPFMPSKIAVMLVKIDFGSVDASTAEWIFLLE